MALFRIPLSPGVPRGFLRKRVEAGTPTALEVLDGDRSAALRYAFAQIRTLRWAPHAGQVLLCGTTLTDEVRSEQQDERGHLRLYAGDLDAAAWAEIGHEWYDDPVELADGVLAVATQNGLRFLAPDGTPIRNQMGGRFSWGAPGLSASPAGTRLAHVRWRGDDQHLCVSTVDGSLVTEFGASCFRYAWWDEDTLVHYLGADLLLLDVTTGATRPAWGGPGTLDLPPGDVALGELAHDHDRTWLSLRVGELGADDATTAIVALDADGGATLEHLLPGRADVEALQPLPDDALAVSFADGTELVLGREPSWWAQGWRPLPEGARPTLGFRTGAFG